MDLPAAVLLHLDEVLPFALGLRALPGEHRPLRVDRLTGRPHHGDDRVAVLARQAWKQFSKSGSASA